MSVIIMTDSTADLTPEAARRVARVNMTLHFGETDYEEGVDITKEEFYKKLTSGTTVPTTSQPTPFTFEQAYKAALEQGDSVVCVTISSRLSGTYQSATIAAEKYPGRVFVVDSRTVTIGAAILVEYALKLADAGMAAGEIADTLIKVREKVRLYAVVDTLEYLKRGGRVSPTVAFAGGLLNIKPIISVEDGEVKLVGKARGAKQSNAQLTRLIAQSGGVDYQMPLMLGYTGLDDTMLRQYMAENSELWVPCGMEPPCSVVGSVVGTHAGPGAVAVAFFAAE